MGFVHDCGALSWRKALNFVLVSPYAKLTTISQPATASITTFRGVELDPHRSDTDETIKVSRSTTLDAKKPQPVNGSPLRFEVSLEKA